MALIGGVIRNASTKSPIAHVANACITGTAQCVPTGGDGRWTALWGYEGVNVKASAPGFNEKLVDFTNNDIAYYPEYGTYGYWKVIELDPTPPGTRPSAPSTH